VQGSDIRYGMLALRNIGEGFVESLVSERELGGTFTDFDDFIERMKRHDMNKKQLEALIKAGALDSLGPRRSQMLAVYEKIMDSDSGSDDETQIDMFSLAEPSVIPVKKTEFPDIPEFTSREKLALEKECSGVYLSGHVLDDYSNYLNSKSVNSISDIIAAFSDSADENVPPLSDKSKVLVGAVVSDRKNKTTRNGDHMAFVSLEDNGGEIELICFTSACEDYGYLLTVGNVLLIEASVSLKDDEVKLILRNAVPIPSNEEYTVAQPETPPSATEKKPPKLYLKVPSQDSPLFKRAKGLVSIFDEGNTPIIFFDSEKNQYLRDLVLLGSVNSFIINELCELLGHENVIYK